MEKDIDKSAGNGIHLISLKDIMRHAIKEVTNVKNKSIKTSILIPALSVLIIGILLMVTGVGALSSSTADNLTERLIDARVHEYSNEFKALCMESYGSASSLAPVMQNLSEDKAVEQPREDAVAILGGTLLSQADAIALWTCWEPNAFDGKDSEFKNARYHDPTGRFVPYVYKDGSGYGVEVLADYDISDYYVRARDSGKPYITDPYEYNYNGNTVTVYSIAFPILKNGSVAGVMGADIVLESFVGIMNAGSILEDGYLFTLSPAGLIATHRDSNWLLRSYQDTWLKEYSTEISNITSNGGSYTAVAFSDITNTKIKFTASGVTIGDTGRNWVVCGAVPMKTVNASSNTIVFMVIAIGLVLILLVGVILFQVVSRRLRDLPMLTETAEAMAVGDIHAANLDAGTEPTKNEIQLLYRAFSGMAKGIQEQAAALGRIAGGDYSMTVPIRSDADIMNKAIGNMLVNTNRIMSEIRLSSSQVESGAVQIAQASQNLATGSSEQAATIEELTATITEIQAKAEMNTNTAEEALRDIRETGHLMNGATESMDQMLHAMQSINESSRDISKVIKVIDDIAFQTNILALNAAVEAARAGQHGKGFAVVADEVRNLASKSAAAAKETAALIEHSLQNSADGNRIVEQTNKHLQAVGQIAGKNTVSITNINEASHQQSNSMREVMSGIMNLSSVVQANSATSEETAASSEEMSAQSVVLNEIISRFKLRESGYGGAPDTILPDKEGISGFALSGDKY